MPDRQNNIQVAFPETRMKVDTNESIKLSDLRRIESVCVNVGVYVFVGVRTKKLFLLLFFYFFFSNARQQRWQ